MFKTFVSKWIKALQYQMPVSNSHQGHALTSIQKTFPVGLIATMCVFSLNTLKVTGQWYFPANIKREIYGYYN